MNSFFHCGEIDNKFQSIIRLCQTNIRKKTKDFIVFDKTILVDRLVQIITERIRNAYIILCGNHINNEGIVPDENEILLLNGISINQTTGGISINRKARLKLAAVFFYVWSQLLIVNMLGLVSGLMFRGKKLTAPGTIFYGMVLNQILHHGTDKRFKDYCDNGPIKPLVDATTIFVQEFKKKGSYSSKDLMYTNSPVSKLLYESNLTVKERITVLFLQVQYALVYIPELINTPLMSLLAKDIAICPIVLALDKFNKIKNILITNSSIYFQPLWMRGPPEKKFITHLILYSQNDKFAVYKHDKLDGITTGVSNIIADEYWVWTEGRKKELEIKVKSKYIHVVGPILWYREDKDCIFKKEADEIRIAVFDVIPINPKVSNKIGILRNQYTTENMLLFIQHIVSVIEEIKEDANGNIELYIKHKRPHSNIHDENYLDYIQALIENETVKLVPSDINLFSFLDSCDLTINATYTSVAYISSHLNKDAVYFDPVDEMVPVYEPSPYITFASNREELLAVVKEKVLSESSLRVRA
jgi:hypothetical protein